MCAVVLYVGAAHWYWCGEPFMICALCIWKDILGVLWLEDETKWHAGEIPLLPGTPAALWLQSHGDNICVSIRSACGTQLHCYSLGSLFHVFKDAWLVRMLRCLWWALAGRDILWLKGKLKVGQWTFVLQAACASASTDILTRIIRQVKDIYVVIQTFTHK